MLRCCSTKMTTQVQHTAAKRSFAQSSMLSFKKAWKIINIVETASRMYFVLQKLQRNYSYITIWPKVLRRFFCCFIMCSAKGIWQFLSEQPVICATPEGVICEVFQFSLQCCYNLFETVDEILTQCYNTSQIKGNPPLNT